MENIVDMQQDSEFISGKRKGEIMCFDFGIVICSDGTEIIDRKQRTFYHQLTPVQMVEYIEMDIQLELMDRLEWKAKKEAQHKRNFANNFLWKIACLCGFCG